MTLTELSVFMKKQELELQLRTEKEREEGEWHGHKAVTHDKHFRMIFLFYF